MSKQTASLFPAIAAPALAALIVNAPQPVMVAAPDTTALVTQYETEILPLSKYTISTPAEYVQGNLDWQKAKAFSAAIEKLFEEPCDLAHKAHKALTNLRSQLKAPADQIAAHVGSELMRYQKEEERKRREEEQRIEREQEAARAAEVARLEAERQIAIAKRLTALEEIPEWERDEEAEAALPPVPPPAEAQLPALAPVRLPPTVPMVMGGPRMVDKPWSAQVTDPVALLKWVLEEPDTRIADCIEFKMPWFNRKAVEFGKYLNRVIPGVIGVREQTLKRS